MTVWKPKAMLVVKKLKYLFCKIASTLLETKGLAPGAELQQLSIYELKQMPFQFLCFWNSCFAKHFATKFLKSTSTEVVEVK